jgi:hypothetical protein
MRATILLAVLSGVGAASAMVVKIAAESTNYDWDVTGWNAGCINEGCFYGSSYTRIRF